MVRFDLGPLFQDQVRIAKLKSGYNSPIIGPRGLELSKQTCSKSWAGSLLIWSHLTSGPSFKVKKI